MFKIHKYFSLARKSAQVSSIRHYKVESQQCPPRYICKQPEPHENDLINEAVRKAAVPPIFRCKSHKDFRIFRNIFFFLCVPAVFCTYLNVYYLNDEVRKRPKFIPYTYLRIRRKPYVWDPVRTLFHNPDYNALPTGYETEFPDEDEYDTMDKYPCPTPKENQVN